MTHETASTAASTLAILEAAREIVRPTVLEYFSADSCIATTRITIDVLSYFGIAAKPLAVETLIFNAEAMERIREGVAFDDLRREVDSLSLEQIGGPWTLGLGFAKSATDAGRHMIAWIPGLALGLDFSLDQASRPHKGMKFDPAIFDMARNNQEALEDSSIPEGYVFPVEIPQDPPYGVAYLEYRVIADWFRGSPNWRRTSTIQECAKATFRDITGRAIKEIRSRVEIERS